MKKESVPVSSANRLINGGPLILVSSHDGQKPNAIAIAWHMPVSHKPMEVAVAVGKSNYSHDIISKTGEYIINIPTLDLLEKVVICGTSHGRDLDKLEKAGLTALPSSKLKCPLIGECVGHIECKVVDTITSGDHSIFVGEVVAASANEGLFDKCWKMEKGLKFIHHLGGKVFSTSSGTVR